MTDVVRKMEQFFSELPSRRNLLQECDPEFPSACFDPIDAGKIDEHPWRPVHQVPALSRQQIDDIVGVDVGDALAAWVGRYWFLSIDLAYDRMPRNGLTLSSISNVAERTTVIDALRERADLRSGTTSLIVGVFFAGEYLILGSDDDRPLIDHRNGTIERLDIDFGEFLLRYGLAEP